MGKRILKVEYDDSQALSYDEVKALVTGNQQKTEKGTAEIHDVKICDCTAQHCSFEMEE